MIHILSRWSRRLVAAKHGRRPAAEHHPRLDALEERCLLSFAATTPTVAPSPSPVRSIDGTGNNLNNPTWGSAGVDLLRVAPAAYADGVSTPAGTSRPSPRVVSNTLSDQGDADIISDRYLSAMIYAWGQFIDHDIDLTPPAAGAGAASFNIAVPKGDPYFDPAGTGTVVIHLTRSLTDPSTGTSPSNPAQQVNVVTAWIDGSQVYGSDATTAAALRTFSGGRLRTSPGPDGTIGTADDLLPFNNSTDLPSGTLPMANDSHLVPDSQLFAAGDVRANENVELTSLHTIFVREHNRIADQLHAANPALDDEALYQGARARVIAELQAITFNEWLPALLGAGAVAPYAGYDPAVNPGIANEFSTALFRFGHSQLGDDVQFLNDDGTTSADEVALSQAFFNPNLLVQNGVASILKYLASDPSSEVDLNVVNSLRNFLFGPPGSGGLDLASLNIQRGRDHGLADYNTVRAAYGLPRVSSFAQITSNADVQQKLQALYGGVDNIDAWVGGLAEDHVAGGSTGPLLRAVLVDQFSRLRNGDRFWYENTFSGQDLTALRQTSLSDVIRRNTTLGNIQGNAFVFRIGMAGTVFGDNDRNGRVGPREAGLAGRTVELLDADGTVVSTTTTDAAGRYRFDVSNDLRLGSYQVRVVLAAGQTRTTPAQTLTYTRGETYLNQVDIGVATAGRPTRPTQGGNGHGKGNSPGRVAHRIGPVSHPGGLIGQTPVGRGRARRSR